MRCGACDTWGPWLAAEDRYCNVWGCGREAWGTVVVGTGRDVRAVPKCPAHGGPARVPATGEEERRP